MLNKIEVTAGTIEYAWFELIFKALEQAKKFKIDQGSFKDQERLEFDHVTVHITQPWKEPMLPKINPALNIPDPVDPDYPNEYVQYLMTDAKAPNEAYTYGARICKGYMPDGEYIAAKNKNKNLIDDFGLFYRSLFINPVLSGWVVNQMEVMIATYKKYGHRNNQMILQVAQPSDILLKDPPCLRHIDTRIQDGKLHFFPYFRSWDLWGGFPANLCVIELMKQYCAEQIGVENGEIIASSKGLHLYDYVWEMVEIIRGKSFDEFVQEISM